MAEKREEKKKQKKDKSPGTFAQMKQVYQMTKKSDPNIGWILLLAVVVTLLVFVLIGALLNNIITFIILGLAVGVLAAMIILGRRAQKAAFTQIEGQPGRAGAAMNSVRRGWIVEEQPVAANRNQDLVLVTEGPSSRVQNLVKNEKKHLNRVVPGVPVHVIETGHDENQVELKDVVKTMNKLPKALTQQEVQGVSNRLSTLNHVRNPMNSIPKGIDPNRVRPDRRAMRGR